MDNTDKKILKILQNNARTTNADIAKELKMAPSASLERLRKLENPKEGSIIEGYQAIINPKSINLELLAFITVKTGSANWTDDIGNKLAKIANIEEIHEILGEDSYLVKIRTKDINELSSILKREIANIDGIIQTSTVMVTNSVKKNSGLKIDCD
ncbi:MAG: Lrp/AsnC family transcriptional regulator [Alphaproteobacteria bacterium]|jgi:Lrp/AsnC family transcriptional regulator, leucine-responsive regulatory protein|nr:Lrp/AsnC family transcriptional regulator [Alphaproteobacteria bacterium]